MQKGFGVREPEYPHFITFAVVDWLPVFIDSKPCDIIIDSLKFCRERKGLRIHGYVIMPTHLHLLGSATNDFTGIVRDFKSFTSKQLKKHLAESGNDIFLWALSRAAELARERDEQSFWQDGYHPEMVYSSEFLEQKLQYIHNNPLRKGLVSVAPGWRYSSAGVYAGELDVPLVIDYLEL